MPTDRAPIEIFPKVEHLHREVIDFLESRADPRTKEMIKCFHKGGEVQAYGMRAADVDGVCKGFKDAFNALTLDERLQLAGHLYHSQVLEQGSTGKYLLTLSLNQLDPTHFDLLDAFLDDFTSWGTTDGFCIDVLQPLLDKYPDEVLELVERWNRSGSVWKRRASVVLFTRKVGSMGEYTAEAIRLCENLIRDEDDLVRKSVGWALKDCMRGEKEPVLAYIKDLRRRGVSSTITLYAIRDLKGGERQEVLAIKPTRG